MSAEQIDKNGRGWVETWEEQENVLARAAEDVKAFFEDPSLAVSEQYDEYFFRPKTVDVKPAYFHVTPRAIQWVLQDLGITGRDVISLEFGLPLKGSGFSFSITPEEVTDERFGIKLTTIQVDPFGKEQGQIITPKGKIELSIAEYAGNRDGDEKLARVGGIYHRISREYEAEANKTITHPFKLKIMVGAVEWGERIMESRRACRLQGYDPNIHFWNDKYPF